MLFKSATFTEASGSIGGMTFARNASGLYVRSNTKPVNPNTEAQQRARSHFAAAIASYGSLDSASQELWRVYGESRVFKNRLGDTIQLNAGSAYAAVNSLRLLAGLTMLLVPPTSPAPHGITPSPVSGDYELTPAYGSSTITIAISNSPDWTGHADARCLVFVSPWCSADRVSPIGNYRFVKSQAGALTPITEISATSPFGPANDGQLCHVKLVLVGGQQAPSVPLFFRSEVTS